MVGKGPGRYNLYLGAAHDGSRLSKLYAEDLEHDAIIAALDPVFAAYAREREPGERFGEFVIRAGLVARTPQRRGFPREHRRAESRVTGTRTPSEARPPRMEALARLPVFYALAGKRAVVAGGSAAAAWKAELLIAAGAAVEVYATEASEELAELAATHAAHCASSARD